MQEIFCFIICLSFSIKSIKYEKKHIVIVVPVIKIHKWRNAESVKTK